jgi:hypothetical protein
MCGQTRQRTELRGPARPGPWDARSRAPGASSVVAASVASACILMGAYTARAESAVAAMYRALLGGSNSVGFVSFSREIAFPAPLRRAAGSGSGGGSQLNTTRSLAYCWSNEKYVAAVSDEHVFTNKNDLLAADYLYGFDGESYWSITRGLPFRSMPAGANGAVPMPPARAANSLILCSKAEVARQHRGGLSGEAIQSVLSLAAECKRLVQFGFPGDIDGRPRITGSEIVVKYAGQPPADALQFKGDPARPARLDRNGPERLRVLTDYQNDSIALAALAPGTNEIRLSEVVYRLHSYSIFSPALDAATFAWQTYREPEGELRGQIVENGELRRIEVPPDNIPQTREIVKPRTAARGSPRSVALPRVLLLCLLAAPAVGLAAILLRLVRRSAGKTQNKGEEQV